MTRLLSVILAATLGATIPCPIHRALALSGPQATAPQTAPQPAPPQSPFAALIAEYLHRDASGHSPTPDEIAAMATLQPQPDAASLREALPYLLKALADPDTPLRSFALDTLIGLQSQPAPPSADIPNPTTPAVYKPEIAKVLAPGIAQIASHLTSEDQQPNRLLTATILGGFSPDPPSSVTTALLAYLKRDDAISPVGLAVVTDLVQIGPLSADTSAAIAKYLRRPDQTADQRADLADLISTSKNQSQTLNKTLLLYLDSDDPSLRARIILSLPQLDLAPDDFADTRSRVEQLAGNPNENLQVVTAAKQVAPCWTETKMPSGCPVY